MDPVKISVIVPAYNEEKLIVPTLRSITAAFEAFRRRGWESELIVCDNNSTDRTSELARNEGAKVVFERINQIGRARNTGAQAAEGDWLLFVDADSTPSAALFDAVASEIESGRTLAGGSTVQLDESHFWAGVLVRGWNLLSRTFRWAAGSFIFCDARAFRQVGGFNEELYVSEELDLSRRLKRFDRTRRLVILHRDPLITSARKLHLYSPAEHVRFLARLVLSPIRARRDRAACAPWYDGRR